MTEVLRQGAQAMLTTAIEAEAPSGLANMNASGMSEATASYKVHDLRGVSGLDLSNAITKNLILPNGHIDGLDLDGGEQLVLRDYDDVRYDPVMHIPIIIDQHQALSPGGTLRMVFEADAWDSTISFAPGIPVALDGTLEPTFDDGVNLASQVGRTFDLFDWTGVNPTGAFQVSSPYRWNVSNLYTAGEVTLTGVPEPRSFLLFSFGFVMLVAARRDMWRRSGRVLHGAASLLPLMAYSIAARPDIFSWRRREIHEALHGDAEALFRTTSTNSRENRQEV